MFDSKAIEPYSSVNVITTEGSLLPGQVYTTVYRNSTSTWVEFLQPSFYVNGIELVFTAPLTTSLDRVDIRAGFGAGSFESNCAHIACQPSIHKTRIVMSGYVTTVVPLPAAIWLFGTAVGGLFLAAVRICVAPVSTATLSGKHPERDSSLA